MTVYSMRVSSLVKCCVVGLYIIYNRALLEAQEIFGLDFDPGEFDQVAREGLGSEDEEEEEDVRLSAH